MYYLSRWGVAVVRVSGVILVVLEVALGRGGEFGGSVRKRGRGWDVGVLVISAERAACNVVGVVGVSRGGRAVERAGGSPFHADVVSLVSYVGSIRELGRAVFNYSRNEKKN